MPAKKSWDSDVRWLSYRCSKFQKHPNRKPSHDCACLHDSSVLACMCLQVYRWPGGATYSGSVLNGLRQGQGRMSFPDSAAVYEGSWVQGLRHGQGRITLNAEGTHWYEGEALLCNTVSFLPSPNSRRLFISFTHLVLSWVCQDRKCTLSSNSHGKLNRECPHMLSSSQAQCKGWHDASRRHKGCMGAIKPRATWCGWGLIACCGYDCDCGCGCGW